MIYALVTWYILIWVAVFTWVIPISIPWFLVALLVAVILGMFWMLKDFRAWPE